MHTRTLLYCGLAAALCRTAGDILLVGFVQEPQRYPLFSHTLAGHLGSRADMAVLMLSGSPQRLFWGVIPATFSIVFYLAAAFGVYNLMHSGRTAKICFALLAAGYALSPLGHAGFYYLGISAQTILAAPPEAHPLLLAQFHRFYTMLDVHWTTAVGLLAFGWLLFLVQTLRGQTRLPRAAWCINPLFTGAIIASACALFPQSTVAAAIGGATFNLAQLLFYACAAYNQGNRQTN